MSDDRTARNKELRLGENSRAQRALDWWIGASAARVIEKLLPIEIIGELLASADAVDPLRESGTVCVRLDGLADKIAEEIARHRWRTGIGRCECGKPVDAYMGQHVAASLLALVQSLAVQ